jgi:hypothetical protein
VFPQSRQEPEVESAGENLVMIDGVDFKADAGLSGPDTVDLPEDGLEFASRTAAVAEVNPEADPVQRRENIGGRSSKDICGPPRQQQNSRDSDSECPRHLILTGKGTPDPGAGH